MVFVRSLTSCKTTSCPWREIFYSSCSSHCLDIATHSDASHLVQGPTSAAGTGQSGPEASSAAALEASGMKDVQPTSDKSFGSQEARAAAVSPKENDAGDAAGEGSAPGPSKQGPRPMQPPAAWAFQSAKLLQGSSGFGRKTWHPVSKLQKSRQRYNGSARLIRRGTMVPDVQHLTAGIASVASATSRQHQGAPFVYT